MFRWSTVESQTVFKPHYSNLWVRAYELKKPRKKHDHNNGLSCLVFSKGPKNVNLWRNFLSLVTNTRPLCTRLFIRRPQRIFANENRTRDRYPILYLLGINIKNWMGMRYTWCKKTGQDRQVWSRLVACTVEHDEPTRSWWFLKIKPIKNLKTIEPLELTVERWSTHYSYNEQLQRAQMSSAEVSCNILTF